MLRAHYSYKNAGSFQTVTNSQGQYLCTSKTPVLRFFYIEVEHVQPSPPSYHAAYLKNISEHSGTLKK